LGSVLYGFEEIIDESFDSLHTQLLDLAPYISSMPEEYTTGLYSSSKGTQDKNHLHAPSPEFFNLLVWNIIVAFWVNIVSTYLYDKIFAQKGELKSHKELKNIRKELITHTKTKGFKLKIGNFLEISDNSKRRSIELLTTYGVPEEEADEKADEINTKLLETLQKLMDDEEKQ